MSRRLRLESRPERYRGWLTLDITRGLLQNGTCSIVPPSGSLNGLSPSSTSPEAFGDSSGFMPFPFLGARSRILIWLATTSTVVRLSPSRSDHFRVCNLPSM